MLCLTVFYLNMIQINIQIIPIKMFVTKINTLRCLKVRYFFFQGHIRNYAGHQMSVAFMSPFSVLNNKYEFLLFKIKVLKLFTKHWFLLVFISYFPFDVSVSTYTVTLKKKKNTKCTLQRFICFRYKGLILGFKKHTPICSYR